MASLGQEAVAMKYANGFRLGMKSLHYAVLIGYPAYRTYKKIQETEISAKATVVEPNVEKFVLDTLHEAYPELKNRTIKVVTVPNIQFAAGTTPRTYYIIVPNRLNDRELESALKYKEKNWYRLSYKECEEKAKEHNLTVHELLALAKLDGIAIDPLTFDSWKGLILHEGSHLLHHDNRTDVVVVTTAPAITLLGTEKLKKALGLHSVFSNRPILGNIIKGLGYIPSLPLKVIASICLLTGPAKYWSEYRADQDTIKRTQDPEILKTLSMWLDNLPEQDTSDLPAKIKLMADPHPRHKTRAKYFAQAAQKLEEKHTKD